MTGQQKDYENAIIKLQDSREVEEYFAKGFITGSYVFSIPDYDDIDILIMSNDIPDISKFIIFNEKKQYDYSLFGNDYDIKFMFGSVLVNLIVFSDEEALNRVKLTTNKLKTYARKHKLLLDPKKVRVSLFEYILRTL